MIGHAPWPTKVDSIFTIEYSDIIFAHCPGFQGEYEVIAVRINEAKCFQFDLSLSERDFVYPF